MSGPGARVAQPRLIEVREPPLVTVGFPCFLFFQVHEIVKAEPPENLLQTVHQVEDPPHHYDLLFLLVPVFRSIHPPFSKAFTPHPM
jgi:hypothetical protein